MSKSGKGRSRVGEADPAMRENQAVFPHSLSGMLNLDGPPAAPRPSATVLLMRGTNPYELLLMQRPGGADFAPGAYVFPGGSVHPQDAELGDEVAAAAVRELFEEVGILLARAGRRLVTDSDSERVRARMESGSHFGSALRDCGLTPALDRLVLLARWVTPARMRRRFDARFFLARLPHGQTVRANESEVTDWLWITPAQALIDPRITLVYATRTVLESVADEPHAARLTDRTRRHGDVPIVEPRLVETQAGWEIVRD